MDVPDKYHIRVCACVLQSASLCARAEQVRKGSAIKCRGCYISGVPPKSLQLITLGGPCHHISSLYVPESLNKETFLHTTHPCSACCTLHSPSHQSERCIIRGGSFRFKFVLSHRQIERWRLTATAQTRLIIAASGGLRRLNAAPCWMIPSD